MRLFRLGQDLSSALTGGGDPVTVPGAPDRETALRLVGLNHAVEAA